MATRTEVQRSLLLATRCVRREAALRCRAVGNNLARTAMMFDGGSRSIPPWPMTPACSCMWPNRCARAKRPGNHDFAQERLATAETTRLSGGESERAGHRAAVQAAPSPPQAAWNWRTSRSRCLGSHRRVSLKWERRVLAQDAESQSVFSSVVEKSPGRSPLRKFDSVAVFPLPVLSADHLAAIEGGADKDPPSFGFSQPRAALPELWRSSSSIPKSMAWRNRGMGA